MNQTSVDSTTMKHLLTKTLQCLQYNVYSGYTLTNQIMYFVSVSKIRVIRKKRMRIVTLVMEGRYHRNILLSKQSTCWFFD